jgi:hypothetical protein
LEELVSAQNTAFHQAFLQAVDDMKIGHFKPIESYLELVPHGERDELARMLSDVLLARGPAPTPSATQSEGYARALAVIDDVLGTVTAAGMLPSALKSMRDARGIEREQVVDTIASDFGITGPAGRKALARNYHHLETGKLLGSKLKRSLMESLARIFQIDVRDLLAGARPTTDPQHPSAAPAMGRGIGGHSASTRSAVAEDLLPDPEVELVEQLFHGGLDD